MDYPTLCEQLVNNQIHRISQMDAELESLRATKRDKKKD